MFLAMTFALALFELPEFKEVRVAGPFPQRRSPIRIDPVEHEWVTKGKVDTANWKVAQPEKDGKYRGEAFAGGYAMFKVHSPREQVVTLAAQGHSMVYVNGVPRGGDVYSYGVLEPPILLKKGLNELLFATGRGELSVKLHPAPLEPVMLKDGMTVFDIHPRQDDSALPIGVLIQNPTQKDVSGLQIFVNGVKTEEDVHLPPLSTRQVPILLELPKLIDGPRTVYDVELKLAGKTVHQIKVPILHKGKDDSFRRTFKSVQDGSVQYYAINPAKDPKKIMATIMSCHGAGVEALGQAQAYGQKEWADIVCPTNRHPFGFNWEDTGRRDFLEVMNDYHFLLSSRVELSEQEIKILTGEPEWPVLLTGHSMGGHGTWHLAAHHPELFRAISPCAGWVSYFSYAGGVRWPAGDPMGEVLNLASNPSDTLLMKQNFQNIPVYMVHGGADEVVKITEAQTMQKELEGISPEVILHEEKGQGHWYDINPAPGADSVDYPPMMKWMHDHAKREPKSIDYQLTTVVPRNEIRQQIRQLAPSMLKIRREKDHLTVTTSNVARFVIPWQLTTNAQTIEVDGQTLRLSSHFVKKGSQWSLGSDLMEGKVLEKVPDRHGLFREILNHNITFVYATGGTPEENAWSKQKALYDAEQSLERANASPRVMSDTEFMARFKTRYDYGFEGGNFLLYGNADTHKAWKRLMTDSPIQVRRGEVRIGNRKYERDDLAAFVIRPNREVQRYQVAAIAPTGAAGGRLANRVPIFTAGAHLPDWTVFAPESLQEGLKGIVGAGFFGNDWLLSPRDSAYSPQFKFK